MFTVDPKSPLPIYEQLVAQIIRSIARGLLRSGEQMPSVRELAGTLLVNPNTVSRAYQELESRNSSQIFHFMKSRKPPFKIHSFVFVPSPTNSPFQTKNSINSSYTLGRIPHVDRFSSNETN